MALRPLIVGNWKMNGTRALLSEARAIDRAAQRVPAVEVALAPPYTLINAVHAEAEHIGVGAQDCSISEAGAHTGDIAASMLADAGAKFAILGHSERRQQHREDATIISRKRDRAFAAGLRVILCCGESLEVREAGQAEQFVLDQLRATMPSRSELNSEMPDLFTIAYEPIWAIGTGRSAAAEDVRQMHGAIAGLLRELYGDEDGGQMRILYGGSVKPENARELLGLPDVHGALVGGASLLAQSFMGIVLAAASEDAPA